jgi:hypothetical protein
MKIPDTVDNDLAAIVRFFQRELQPGHQRLLLPLNMSASGRKLPFAGTTNRNTVCY